ncbi:hypothetical protein VaNZ11_002140 [Volvox africanus]|uniref:Uncharacterized protein n=1 Tax=Volvox africanus TaxID=51714 RepID=A0ABQ5RRN2_9CHLO|nr:hypothetical protein VaNZ11_002140 [Volvox africanus]
MYGVASWRSVPSEGMRLVVEQDTWQLISFLWIKNDIDNMASPQNGTSDTVLYIQSGSTQELCGAFVNEIRISGETENFISYCFSLRVQNSLAADSKILNIDTTTINEAQWLADEVNKHIKIVKEQPFPATPLCPSVPMDPVIIRPVTINNDNPRTSEVATQEQSSAASLAVIAREPSGPPQFSSLVDKWPAT